MLDFHASLNCVNSLLSILRSEGLHLPKDTRSLLKTPKIADHKIISIHPGSYIHLGVEYMISKIFILHHIDNNLAVKLSVNIDGLPLSSSSKSSFWPILVSFINIPKLLNIVIPIGIYHGKFKNLKRPFDCSIFRY